LYVHIIGGHRLSLFYASEEFFVIRGHPKELKERIRGHPPVSTQLPYYGHTITIAAPPLASACLSVFMLAVQPNAFRSTPGYMKEYIPGRTFSERMDAEWYRLIMCPSITSSPKGLGGSRVTPSTLVGSWNSTILIPHTVEFTTFLRSNQPRDAFNTTLIFMRGEMELREHHSLGDEVDLMAGLGPDRVGDDPLNAWIPQGATFNEGNGTLEILDPIEDLTVKYETYRTDAEHPYVSGYVPDTHWYPGDRENSPEEETSEHPQVENEPNIPHETQGSLGNALYVDDDREFHDTVEHRYSGIKDIIITGTMKSVDHEHRLVGRIRSWDGLIILLRQPNPNDPPELGWVFRGYVHGERHIVGRWKRTGTPFGEIGWEGGFIFSKNL